MHVGRTVAHATYRILAFLSVMDKIIILYRHKKNQIRNRISCLVLKYLAIMHQSLSYLRRVESEDHLQGYLEEEEEMWL